MPKRKKPEQLPDEKHPKDMTTEELAKHLFHPNLHKKLKEMAHEKDTAPGNDSP